jgi:hypothetical protein
VPGRVAEWQVLLDRAASRQSLDDGAVRLSFARGDFAELARLVDAEQECCAFFAFTITVDAEGVVLDVRAPVDAAEMTAALFGGAGSGA